MSCVSTNTHCYGVILQWTSILSGWSRNTPRWFMLWKPETGSWATLPLTYINLVAELTKSLFSILLTLPPFSYSTSSKRERGTISLQFTQLFYIPDYPRFLYIYYLGWVRVFFINLPVIPFNERIRNSWESCAKATQKNMDKTPF